MNKLYIFIISLLNFSAFPNNMSRLVKNLKISPKVINVLNDFKIYSFGGKPLWSDLLNIAQRKIV